MNYAATCVVGDRAWETEHSRQGGTDLVHLVALHDEGVGNGDLRAVQQINHRYIH